jgi:hypothetical protein
LQRSIRGFFESREIIGIFAAGTHMLVCRRWPDRSNPEESCFTMSAPQAEPSEPPARKIHLFGRHVHLPRSRWLRIAIGVVLVIFGIFGFLPILGFWMIPLGLLVLSYEFAVVRRWRRRFVVWWERRKAARG